MPARRFGCGLLCIIAYDNIFRLYGANGHRAKLHGLLNDKLHLLALEKCLHKEDFGCPLSLLWEFLCKTETDDIMNDRTYLHAGDTPVSRRNNNLVADACTHDTHEMMRIAACDLDFLRELPRIE